MMEDAGYAVYPIRTGISECEDKARYKVCFQIAANELVGLVVMLLGRVLISKMIIKLR